MKEFFTIDDLATMTMLSTRTLRNYIKQGFFDGEKIDGVWKFTTEDIDRILKNDFINQSIQSKKNGIVYEYMANDIKLVNTVCSIYDYNNIGNEEAKRMCSIIMDLINTNQYDSLKFSYSYNQKTKMVRIILTGTTNGIYNLMNTFSEKL
ncbi:MAG: transcriptional regulator, MerR family [Clostridiales bacterium]|jgi:hypothetical protein|nr:transcriptional regulator, MerR family [Clostridiales bacterium]